MKLFVILLCLLLPANVMAQGGHGLERIIKAYPAADFSVFYDANGNVYLNASGQHILFQSLEACPGAAPESKQDQALCAMFQQKYSVGKEGRKATENFNPGRVRNEELMKFLYGESEAQVEKNCVTVNFFGQNLLFNNKHGAAEALKRVELKLRGFINTQPEKKKYILPSAGTFMWRYISGSRRLSSHSFAVAIDLNVKNGPYWRWSDIETANEYWESYPQEIVDIFESEGFIWGGKWNKFDFMHFEYRPELLN